MDARASIPFQRATYGPAEEDAVVAVLRSGATGGGGPVGTRCEEALARLTGSEHVLLVTSCTHAMEAALIALGVGPGDEVIVPGFTYVSAVTAIARQGARPVFVDIEPERFGLDPERIEEAIGPCTRAILPVHYGGWDCHGDAISRIAQRHGLPVIEDAAHGIGSTTASGRALGTAGAVGCLSFHETKNVSCGEGGALLVRDAETAARLERIRDKGTNRAACMRGETPHYTWVSPGSSLTLSELNAAVLEVQLRRIEEIQAARTAVAAGYLERLAPLVAAGRVEGPPVPARGERFNWHLFHVLVPADVDRDAVTASMRESGVGTAAHFQPLDGSPEFRRLCPSARPSLPITRAVSSRILRLPIYPSLGDDEVHRVVDALDRALESAGATGAP